MSAPATLVFDTLAADGGARRPAIADVGGAILEDHATKPPPKNGTHLYKDMCNQWQLVMAALGRMIPTAKLTVDFSAGAPFIDKIQTASAQLVAGDFTIADDGVGVTRIQWTSTKLPAPTCRPELTLHGAGTHCGSVTLALNTAGAGAGVATPGTHRIIITTTVGATGAAADVAFTVSIN